MSAENAAPRDTVKNGHSASGSQQYHCKDCGAHKVLGSKAAGLFRGGERENPPSLPRTRVKAGNQPHLWHQSLLR
ncbi:IS1/IS1595 family N-terminal zinc-binding domain-containing protein [Salinibacter ruber]|uniref:IS1/IS1595 family N-terminal zinc-binding domain-containing protein n=1 Tax=Salinibacter ruber TaxID=146919 RepID=UPI003C6E6212